MSYHIRSVEYLHDPTLRMCFITHVLVLITTIADVTPTTAKTSTTTPSTTTPSTTTPSTTTPSTTSLSTTRTTIDPSQTSLSPICPKCGTVKNSGKRTCCAADGAWSQNCGDAGEPQFDHTWAEGTWACERKPTTSSVVPNHWLT